MAIKINGATVIDDSQNFTSTGNVSATGNITAGNIIGNVISTGPISTTGNISGGNLIVTGNIIDTGNLSIVTSSTGNTWTFDTTGNLVFPGGGLIRSKLDSGNTGVALFANNGNGEVSLNWSNNNFVYVDGTGTYLQSTGFNIVQLTNDGQLLVGANTTVNVSATGNIVGANLRTGGAVSATGTVTGGNVTTAGTVSATGTITGGNIATAGTISATGAIQGGNLTVGNAIVTGNLTVNGTETIFNVANLTVNDKDIIVANNVTGGANVDGSGIQAGNPATATWFFNNATTSWQSNIGITPTTNGTLSLGGASNYWGTAFVTTASVTGNVQAGNVRTTGLISATGQITGSQFNGSGAGLTSIPNSSLANSSVTVNGTAIALGGSGTVTANAATLTGTVLNATVVTSSLTSVGTLGSLSVTGTATVGNVSTAGFVSATGNVNGGNLNVTGNIVDTGAMSIITGSNGNLTLNAGTGFIIASSSILNGQANGVGNIGNSTGYFDTIFAKATSAQYADLAEKYTADADYEPGTVVMFGGDAEVTICSNDACRRVAGVISTNPSYIMNGTLVANHVATVALTGRVPTKVTGTVRKGDLMVSAGNGRARAEADPRVGTVIGKALADHDGAEGVIEVVVGRF